MATLAHALFTGPAGQTLQTYAADSGATFSKHSRSGSANLVLDGTGGLRNSGSGVPAVYLCDVVPTTAEQWGTVTYERLTADAFQGAYLLFRCDDALLSGYAIGYNVSTGRVEFYRLSDDGTTADKLLLDTRPVLPIAVGGSTAMEVHVLTFADRVRLIVTWGGAVQAAVDDTDPARITTIGQVGFYQRGAGGNNTDGVHIDEALFLDAAAGSTPPIAPASVVGSTVNATSALLESVDASTDETGWHDVWAPDDGTGQPDETNVTDLGTFPSTTGAATGGTISRTVTGLPPDKAGIFLGRRSMGIGGESATTWATQSIDTPPLPRILSIDSPHGTDQITPGTRVVLAGTYENAAAAGDWYRGDPDDGGTLLGADPYVYDTAGRPEGDEELFLLIANATGDTDKASVILPLGAAAAPTTGGLILGGIMRYVSAGETALGPRRVEVLIRNADGTAATDQAGVTPLLVVDGQPTDAAANPLEAKSASSGRYYHTYATAELATVGQLLEIAIDGLEVYGSEVLVQSGVAVDANGKVPASSVDALGTQAKTDVGAAVNTAVPNVNLHKVRGRALTDTPPFGAV